MIATCRSTTRRMMWVAFTWSVKIAAVPVAPAGRLAAKAWSSRRTRTTSGAVRIADGAMALPDVWVWPLATAWMTVYTLPVKMRPGANLKVISTAWPGSI